MKKKLLKVLASSNKSPDEICWTLIDEAMTTRVIMNNNDPKKAFKDMMLDVQSVAAQYGMNVITDLPKH